MVFHRHLHAAVVDRGLGGIHTSCRRQRRMNRGPNEEGKAGQDNEQPPEDQDTHACNITQISTVVQAETLTLRAKGQTAFQYVRLDQITTYPLLRSYGFDSRRPHQRLRQGGATARERGASFPAFKKTAARRVCAGRLSLPDRPPPRRRKIAAIACARHRHSKPGRV